MQKRLRKNNIIDTTAVPAATNELLSTCENKNKNNEASISLKDNSKLNKN